MPGAKNSKNHRKKKKKGGGSVPLGSHDTEGIINNCVCTCVFYKQTHCYFFIQKRFPLHYHEYEISNKGALDKYNIIPQLSPKKLGFFFIQLEL